MISVVVPVFNQVHLTRRCLESLLLNSRQANQLVVVDNFSKDQTSETLLEFKKRFEERGWKVLILTNERNEGFGRACNRGIRACSSEFVAVLNNDTWLMPDWDGVLLRRMSELAVDMVGPYYDESPFDEVRTPKMAERFVKRNRLKHSSEWVSILMLFKRDVLNELGLFDERFFVTYEDSDLRERMSRAGKTYAQVGDCFIWHFSQGTRGTQDLPKGYELEGLRLFVEKWGFDPRVLANTRRARLKRRWTRIKNRFGFY